MLAGGCNKSCRVSMSSAHCRKSKRWNRQEQKNLEFQLLSPNPYGCGLVAMDAEYMVKIAKAAPWAG